MALDWNKEISLGSLGKAKKKSGTPDELASKTSMNLVSRDPAQTNPVTTAIVGVVLAIVIILFAKFAVIDQLAGVNALRGELAEQQGLLAAAQAELEEYDAVLAEYQSYSSADQAGLEYPDALFVIKTINRVAKPYGTTTSVAVGQGVATVNIENATLREIGALAKELKEQAVFTDVSVSTAANKSAESKVEASLSIKLAGRGEDAGTASQDTDDEAAEG